MATDSDIPVDDLSRASTNALQMEKFAAAYTAAHRLLKKADRTEAYQTAVLYNKKNKISDELDAAGYRIDRATGEFWDPGQPAEGESTGIYKDYAVSPYGLAHTFWTSGRNYKGDDGYFGAFELKYGPAPTTEQIQEAQLALGLITATPQSTALALEFKEGSTRQNILVNTADIHICGGKAIRAMKQAPEIYTTFGRISKVLNGTNGRKKLMMLDDKSVGGALSDVASFYSWAGGTVGSRKMVVPCPGRELCHYVLAQSDELFTSEAGLPPLSFRELDGIVNRPIARVDGTILDKEGYDPASKLYYAPIPGEPGLDIPESPDKQAAEAALRKVAYVIKDFPFVSGADRDNALGALLSLFCRDMFPFQMAVAFSANQRNTGKTKLAQILAKIATGSAPLTGIARANESDEWDKILATCVLQGTKAILFDNVTKPIGPDALSTWTTSEKFGARALGTNVQLMGRTTTLIMISGNVLKFNGDFGTRVYTVNLDAGVANPGARHDFTEEDLDKYVRENEATILGGVYTMIKAWALAGRPRPTRECPDNRFVEWYNVIGGILQFAGADEFLANLAKDRDESDETAGKWIPFMQSLIGIQTPNKVWTTRQILGMSTQPASSSSDDPISTFGHSLPPDLQLLLPERDHPKFLNTAGKAFGEIDRQIFSTQPPVRFRCKKDRTNLMTIYVTKPNGTEISDS